MVESLRKELSLLAGAFIHTHFPWQWGIHGHPWPFYKAKVKISSSMEGTSPSRVFVVSSNRFLFGRGGMAWPAVLATVQLFRQNESNPPALLVAVKKQSTNQQIEATVSMQRLNVPSLHAV